MKELCDNALEVLESFLKDPTLTEQDRISLGEAIARLSRLIPEILEILETNSTLLAANPALKEIRETMLTEDKIRFLIQEIAKTEPEVAKQFPPSGRIKISGVGEISAYNLAAPQSKDVDVSIQALHAKTESVYQSLWVIKGKLNEIPRFKNFNPVGVRDVRNHLIEHTNGPGSGAKIYSFGISTGGPVLRPMKPQGAKAPHDRGLAHNIQEFLNEIKSLSDVLIAH